MITACVLCGNAFDYDAVTPNPGRHCPNASCRAPLDAVAVESMHFEADNPSNPHDSARVRAREQAAADVKKFRKQLKKEA